jgi:hypothetical protein
MTRWYRAYEGIVTDAKLGEAAMVAECSRSVAIAAWHAILESCASANDKGRFSTTARRISVILCEPPKVIDALFAEFTSLGMIDGDVVSAWAKRQFESDNSTERSRRHRETRRHVPATLQGRDATPPETETETETEKKPNQEPSLKAETLSEPAKPVADDGVTLVDLPKARKSEKRRDDYPPGFQQFWIGYPTDPNMSKTSAFSEWEKLSRAEKETVIASLPAFNLYCRTHNDYRPVHAVRYLKDRRFEGHAESAAKLAVSKGVYVRIGTQAWRAWEAYYRQLGKGSPMTDKAGNGWYFPNEFPPESGKEHAA